MAALTEVFSLYVAYGGSDIHHAQLFIYHILGIALNNTNAKADFLSQGRPSLMSQ